MMNLKIILLGLCAATLPIAPAYAQDAQAFMDRANTVYAEHLQCGVDLALAIPAHEKAGGAAGTRFQEAFTQYMNRLLGVAAATGRQQSDVLSAIRAGVAEFSSRLSAAKLNDAQMKELNDGSSQRTRACLQSIGYQAS